MTNFPGPLGRLSPPRRRLWLAIIALVSAVVLVPLGVNALDSPPDAAPAAQDRPGPVLLVPGYGGSTASLEVLADRLRAEGRDVRLVPAPGDGTGDLREQAVNLGEAVSSVLQRTGAPSVDLVGYSAGGVVVRWYVAFLGGTDVVRRVVTLASPHHGTDLAALASGVGGDACPEACQQLDPDSDVIFDINRGDETPAGPTWVALWTDDDATVVPPDSGRLDGAVSYAVQDVCTGLVVSHGDMPRDPSVEEMVVDALGVAAPRVPGPGVCR